MCVCCRCTSPLGPSLITLVRFLLHRAQGHEGKTALAVVHEYAARLQVTGQRMATVGCARPLQFGAGEPDQRV